LLTCNEYGDGRAYYFATPLLTAHGDNVVPPQLMQRIFEAVVPSPQRWITTNASEHVEIVLRKRADSVVLHLVNMAEGEREVVKSGRRRYTTIHHLPAAGPCQVSIRTSRQPSRVTLQPQAMPLANWDYDAGRVQATVPQFQVHQMVVLDFDE
jgi:hypothetical protein